MNKIKVNALSVNKCWQGRRYRTREYDLYERLVLYSLPKKLAIPKGHIRLVLEFGMSNKASDIDNPLKPLLDILQKKYNFNDKQIYELSVEKKDVKKGKEYIAFEITEV